MLFLPSKHLFWESCSLFPKTQLKDNDKSGTVPFFMKGYGEQQSREVSVGANEKKP